MRKQITSLLLTLAMLLSLVPALGVTASAAEPEEWTIVNSFDELKAAMERDTETHIKLGKDIDTNDEENHRLGLTQYDMIEVRNTITLDLNGKKLTLNSGWNKTPIYIRVWTGELTVQDRGSGGEIFLYNKADNGCSLIQVDEGTFTLKSGTLRATTSKPEAHGITLIYNFGKVNIEGGTLTCTQQGGEVNAYGGPDNWSSCYALKCSQRDTVQTTISDGTFTGYVKICANNKGKQSTISNGTFNNGVIFDLEDEKNMTWAAPGLTVSGGTFKEETSLSGLRYHEKSTDIAAIISGGTFGPFEVVSRGRGVFVVDYDQYRNDHKIKQGYYPYQLLGGTYANLDFGGIFYPSYGLTSLHEAFRSLLSNGGIKVGDTFYPFFAIEKATLEDDNSSSYLDVENPNNETITVIPDALRGMKSVTLDGDKEIYYAKDWRGSVQPLNNKAHTLKFEWDPLAQELKDAGYSYRIKCEHYISGSTAVQKTENIDANATSHTVTIPKGEDPKIYSFDLFLDLVDKNGNPVGIYGNEHIVKLAVSEAPEVKTLTGKVNYINGTVFGKPVLFSGTITPGVYIWECQFRWQRSTDGGSTWKDIPDATDGQYIPGAADMGENVRIRVIITKEGYLGEIVSTPAKVSKAANDNTPAWPDVTAQKNANGTYTAFQINNFKSDQEYVYTTSVPAPGNEWPTSGTPITSATVDGLNKGSTYYVFTRYKGTDTHQAGSKIRSTSVLLDEITKLSRVILTGASGKEYSFYGSGNTIYIKKGESVTLTAKMNPGSANECLISPSSPSTMHLPRSP